ncbi:MAG: acyltransferase, partial [Micrococcales bacterium]|nr:acyltransferase [Micrococcales bacterium]
MSAEASRGAYAPRLDSLTGLRWWAAFGVFLHHMGNVAPLPARDFLVRGNYGVTFFFVLSGFVLTWSARPGLPASTFWWRRFARIWPAHAVALLLAVPVFYALSPDPARWWVKPLDLGVLALSVVLMQGWWRDPAILFSGNPAAWTLTCEAFFYALHPALLRGFRGVGRRGTLAMTAGVVGVAVLLRVASLVSPDSIVSGAPWPVLRLTEFVIGIGVARGMRLGWRPPIRPLTAYLLIAAILVAGHAMPGSLAAAFTNEAVIVAFALLIAAVALRDVEGGPSLLRSRPLVVLGEWSYSFYLVHATVIYAALTLVGARPSSWAGLLWYPPILLACLVLAAGLHLLVERPAERSLRTWWDDRRAAATHRAVGK